MADDAPAPPPRPKLSDTTPPPIVPLDPPPPGPVQRTRVWWLLAVTAGFITVLFGFTRRNAIAPRLVEAVIDRSPGLSADAAATLADNLSTATLGALLLITILQIVWMRRLLARRPWTRTAQAITLLVHVPVALVAATVLAPPGAGAVLDRGVVLGHLVLSAVAVLYSLNPRVTSWLHDGAHQTPRSTAS